MCYIVLFIYVHPVTAGYTLLLSTSSLCIWQSLSVSAFDSVCIGELSVFDLPLNFLPFLFCSIGVHLYQCLRERGLFSSPYIVAIKWNLAERRPLLLHRCFLMRWEQFQFLEDRIPKKRDLNVIFITNNVFSFLISFHMILSSFCPVFGPVNIDVSFIHGVAVASLAMEN